MLDGVGGVGGVLVPLALLVYLCHVRCCVSHLFLALSFVNFSHRLGFPVD